MDSDQNTPEGVAKLPRTFVYIDGFNLYYRNLKNTPYKWLDIEKLCETLLLPNTPIIKIKYFTSRINAKTNTAEALNRQDIYLKAITQWCKTVEIIEGAYKVQTLKRPLAQTLPCIQDQHCHSSNLVKI